MKPNVYKTLAQGIYYTPRSGAHRNGGYIRVRFRGVVKFIYISHGEAPEDYLDAARVLLCQLRSRPLEIKHGNDAWQKLSPVKRYRPAMQSQADLWKGRHETEAIA